MDLTIRTLIDAKKRINASSVEERVSGIRELVAAVNAIEALPPDEQVSALTNARRTVEELRERVAAVTAEYEDAHAWLKVLEGVAMGAREGVPVAAAAAPRRSDGSTVASTQVADASGRAGQ